VCAAPPAAQRLPVDRAGNLFFARASVNGRATVWLTVDTGANLTVLDPAVAQSLDLPVLDPQSRTDVGSGEGPTDFSRTRGVAMRVGDLPEFAPPSLFLVPVRSLSGFVGHAVDGVLGVDFMLGHVVEFDYRAGAVIFHDARSFVYRGTGQRLPMDITGNVVTVRGSVTLTDATTLGVRWLVDTGRAGRPLLGAPFVRAHRLVERFAIPAEFGMSRSVNGFMRSRTASLAAIEFGSLRIDRPDVDLSEADSGLSASDRYDGHLGAVALSRFRMIVDFPRRELILEPR